MKIYEHEKKDGISDLVQANASLAYLCKAEFDDSKNKKSLNIKDQIVVANNQDSIDLFYMKDIMVSTGWNNNRDIFTNAEVWPARSTPEDKPFNIEHNQKQIIGHMTGSYVIDEESNIVANDTKDVDLPAKFHVVSTSVIYTRFMDKEYQESIAKVVEEIKEGKWCVSMEALFDDFDYGVIDKEGKNFVIARNDQSSFLTKYLTAYKGTGEYQGYKLGRLLKNIVFSGKGLVKNPANPESVIFNDTAAFSTASYKDSSCLNTKAVYETNSENKIQESNKMADELLQKQVDELKASLKEATAAKIEAEKQLRDIDVKSVQAKVNTLTIEVKAKDDKIATLEASAKTLTEAKASVEEKLVKVEKDWNTAKAELDTVKAKQVKAERIATLAGKLNLKAEVAEALAESLSPLSDEHFSKYVEAAKSVPAKEKEDSDEDKAKKAKEEKDKKDAAAKASTDTAILDNAQASKEVTLSTSSTDTGVEATRTAIASFIFGKNKTQEK